MKTITEFSGFVLKDAMAKKAAMLAEGKSDEEAQGSVNELLKLDETKAPLYKNVVDMTASRAERVKRVVVATKASETEKVPESYMEREGHFYLIEYYPDPNARAPARSTGRDDFRGGSGGGRGNDRGGGGRGGSGGGRGGDGQRGDAGRGRGAFDQPRGEARPERAQPAPRPDAGKFAPLKPVDPNAPKPTRAPREQKPRDQQARGPRPERKDREPRGPKGAGELRLVLKDQKQTTFQGSGPSQGAADVVSSAPAIEAPSAPATE